MPSGVDGHPDRRPTLLLDSFGALGVVITDRNYPLEASMAVRVDLNISLDGFATTTDQTPEHPMGQDWSRLVAAYVATRTFRERVLHDTSGEGTSGVDDDCARACFAEVGAEISRARSGLPPAPSSRCRSNSLHRTSAAAGGVSILGLVGGSRRHVAGRSTRDLRLEPRRRPRPADPLSDLQRASTAGDRVRRAAHTGTGPVACGAASLFRRCAGRCRLLDRTLGRSCHACSSR